MEKEIDLIEYKKKLIEMFTYLNNICRKNNINYSLFAGSLIGCVREGGIIPWDDDIDILIPHEEINHLIEVVNSDLDSNYKIISFENNKSYYYPFPKLVDTRTKTIEINQKEIDDYGIFIDLFQYNNMPNNKILSNLYYYKIKFYEQLFTGYAQIEADSFFKKIRNWYANFLGLEKIMSKYKKFTEKYNNKTSDYVISNWPIYKKYKEIQKSCDIISFTDSKFENINAMILTNYDSILSTTFGDYMTPPPKDKQVTHHNMKSYYINK